MMDSGFTGICCEQMRAKENVPSKTIKDNSFFH